MHWCSVLILHSVEDCYTLACQPGAPLSPLRSLVSFILWQCTETVHWQCSEASACPQCRGGLQHVSLLLGGMLCFVRLHPTTSGWWCLPAACLQQRSALSSPVLGCPREDVQLAGIQMTVQQSHSYDSPAHALSCTAYEGHETKCIRAHAGQTARSVKPPRVPLLQAAPLFLVARQRSSACESHQAHESMTQCLMWIGACLSPSGLRLLPNPNPGRAPSSARGCTCGAAAQPASSTAQCSAANAYSSARYAPSGPPPPACASGQARA